jgi:hypothetical protein
VLIGTPIYTRQFQFEVQNALFGKIKISTIIRKINKYSVCLSEEDIWLSFSGMGFALFEFVQELLLLSRRCRHTKCYFADSMVDFHVPSGIKSPGNLISLYTYYKRVCHKK